MTVHCPHCSTGYLLPDHLMGPRGARVRCPHCKRPFVVLREEAGTIETAPDAPDAPADPPDPADPALRLAEDAPAPLVDDAEPSRIAEELLDSLALHLGGALTQARTRGRVLAEFGPEVMKAFDEYRSRLGDRAAPDAFRAALKERWGVDLAN